MISVQQGVNWISKGNASIPQLLLEKYKQLQLSDAEMMLILHIHTTSQQAAQLPDIKQLQERMTCSNLELSKMLNRLRKEHYIDVQTSVDEEGKEVECFSIEPLWEKLVHLLTVSPEMEGAAAQDTYPPWPDEVRNSEDLKKLEGEIYRRFELEFGRSLSPMECETIAMWLDKDHYEPHLIFLALREAVISNKLSLRYIDRILFEWQKSGLQTVEEVREHSRKFRKQQFSGKKRNDPSEPPLQFSFYNWLEK